MFATQARRAYRQLWCVVKIGMVIFILSQCQKVKAMLPPLRHITKPSIGSGSRLKAFRKWRMRTKRLALEAAIFSVSRSRRPLPDPLSLQ